MKHYITLEGGESCEMKTVVPLNKKELAVFRDDPRVFGEEMLRDEWGETINYETCDTHLEEWRDSTPDEITYYKRLTHGRMEWYWRPCIRKKPIGPFGFGLARWVLYIHFGRLGSITLGYEAR